MTGYGATVEGNQKLMSRMDEAGFTQNELAEAVNAYLRALGHDGTVSDRTVRNWLTGKTRWPHSRQREALETVFNCRITELGFAPRGEKDPLPSGPMEDRVLRRHFISASAGIALTAASATPAHGHSVQRRVGAGDVERLLSKFSALIMSDQQYGGRLTIETQASSLAAEALALQERGTASQRVRGALYACAASFTSSAMWAAIDGRRFDEAQTHFDRAASLAAMSGDSTIQFRIWSHAGSLYRHLGRPADALAANDVARGLPIARRDPLFASLGHARHAVICGLVGNATDVRRAIGHAREALDRADPHASRPVWMTAVRDQGEIEELALSAHLSLGNFERAEAHAHRSLVLLRPYMKRDRAIVTARLAHAQLGQGDIELAIGTAQSIPSGVFTRHPRVTRLLGDFGVRLHTAAPSSSFSRAWDEYAHDSRRDNA